ncbi:MAG: DUF547 domain-containing protein [Pseudomonadota bacterium]
MLWLEKRLVPKSHLLDGKWAEHDPTSRITLDHSSFDLLLQKHTALDGGGIRKVSYGAFTQADGQLLADYIAGLEGTDPSNLVRSEQYAFWINLYNAAVLRLILDQRLTRSMFDAQRHPLDIKRPFHIPMVSVCGIPLSLHGIESGILRPVWRSPLLHYGLNCGAVSCPNIGPEAYRSKSLNDDLERAARAFVNDPRGVATKDRKLILSKIYFWYMDDFGGSEAALLDHIRAYAAPDLHQRLEGVQRVDGYAYDWSLNGSWG